MLLRSNGSFEPSYAIGPTLTTPVRALDEARSWTPIFNSANDGRAPDPESPELLLPLPGRTQLLGAMALGPKRSEEPYTPSDLRLLESVSLQTGLGLELPSHPCSPRSSSDGRLGLAIGDVSGKGISAALLMASLRACLRTMTRTASGELTQLMAHMNRLIYEASAINRYATFFFGIFDPAANTFNYVNAGHNPPALLRRSANRGHEWLRLDCGGPVIGLLPEASFEQSSLLLHPGDLLLLYTDGISEAMNSAEEEWGDEAMMLAAREAVDGTAEDIVKAIFAAADTFAGKASQHDDMTVLVMKVSQVSGQA